MSPGLWRCRRPRAVRRAVGGRGRRGCAARLARPAIADSSRPLPGSTIPGELRQSMGYAEAVALPLPGAQSHATHPALAQPSLEESGAVVPCLLTWACEAQPCLMHPRGGLERLTGRFVRHSRGQTVSCHGVPRARVSVGGLDPEYGMEVKAANRLLARARLG